MTERASGAPVIERLMSNQLVFDDLADDGGPSSSAPATTANEVLASTPDDDPRMMNSRVSALRPGRFEDYPGQTRAKENLRVYVAAAKMAGRQLDHVLLHGPPGLGKTTLAHIVARELNRPFVSTSAPTLDKAGDLAGILASLAAGTVLFVDEIHRLPIQIEEVLYGAMEDYTIDLIIGQGQTARSVKMPIAPFTLVGATTKLSNLSAPFVSRFGIQERLEYYDQGSLSEIIGRSASILMIALHPNSLAEIARRSRGTPRIANRLLRRVWDFALVAGEAEVSLATSKRALRHLDIDAFGLDPLDRKILSVIHERYSGGPVGIDAIAATIGEERATIEDVYEPYLVSEGFITRSPRGRMTTAKAQEHLYGHDATAPN